MKKIIALFVLLFGLNVIDVCQTFVGLKMGATEINPLQQHLNVQGVTFIDVLAKLGLPSLLFLITLFAFAKVGGKWRIPFYSEFLGLSIFYSIVVAKNFLLFI